MIRVLFQGIRRFSDGYDRYLIRYDWFPVVVDLEVVNNSLNTSPFHEEESDIEVFSPIQNTAAEDSNSLHCKDFLRDGIVY